MFSVLKRSFFGFKKICAFCVEYLNKKSLFVNIKLIVSMLKKYIFMLGPIFFRFKFATATQSFFYNELKFKTRL